MKKRLELFKHAVESRSKFSADDFVWGFREIKKNTSIIFWALFLKQDVYSDFALLGKDPITIKYALNELEYKAINCYEYLKFYIRDFGYYLNHPSTIRTANISGEFNVLKVKLGDAKNFESKIAEIYPNSILFDSKEDILEHLKNFI